MPQMHRLMTNLTADCILLLVQNALPGTKTSYGSIEADVVGVIPHYAVKRSISDYLQESCES